MNSVEQAILNSILLLESTAAARGTIGPILSQLDLLSRQLPKDTSPDLLHYLHKRSYEKARLLLSGFDPEAGPCPR
jgi:hypothetical protein